MAMQDNNKENNRAKKMDKINENVPNIIVAPPLTITEELAGKAIDIIDEVITETEKHFGIS